LGEELSGEELSA
jgi:hypothetical protein